MDDRLTEYAQLYTTPEPEILYRINRETNVTQVYPQMRPGGFILADNVLWGGKVLNPPEKWDKDTRGIAAFNEFVQQDKRVENIILPFRDGCMVIKKLG